MTEANSEPRKKIHSMGFRFMAFLALYALIAIVLFLASHRIFLTYIENSYLSEEESIAREEQYFENLQKYVETGKIYATDTQKIAVWVRLNPYIYLSLYRGNVLYFEGGFLPEQSEGEEVKLPSAPHAIKMSDGVIYATLIDSTEHIYYDFSYVFSSVIALAFFFIAMFIYFRRITRKISKLAGDVSKIGAGELEVLTPPKGKDEITSLADDVNRMCISIRENAVKEREAWEANAGLITAMSHDLRTPLTVLMGYLDIIAMQEELSQDTKNYLQTCKATAERLKGLSDDMFLYFYVFGTSELKSAPDYFPAAVLLDQLLSEHMVLLSEKKYTVLCDEIPEGVLIYADAALLSRVIDNLFSNLLKYADVEKPIVISVTMDADTFRLSFHNEISPVKSKAESSGIGTKTCARMLKAMEADYVITETEEAYDSEITFRSRLDHDSIRVD